MENTREQIIYSAARDFFGGKKGSRFAMRLCIRMRDFVDPEALQEAVDETMERFPFFKIKSARRKDQNRKTHYYFAPNNNPIKIFNSRDSIPLGGSLTGGHFVAFCYYENWIFLEMYHALTDGQGSYNVARLLLNKYCMKRYNIDVSLEGLANENMEIEEGEWEDPIYELREQLPPEQPLPDLPPAFRLDMEDHIPTTFNITVEEKEFMRFSKDSDGSPCTIVALLLARAIAELHKDDENIDNLRLLMSVNMRPAIKRPLAHHTLVKDILLKFPKKMHDWDFERQSTAFRGMTILNSDNETIYQAAGDLAGVSERILSLSDLKAKVDLARKSIQDVADQATALVSYVGKAGFRDSENYIRDFASWVGLQNDLVIEIAAVNNKFYIDFEQHFSSRKYVEQFLKELEARNITYDLRSKDILDTPRVILPWTEDSWYPAEE